MSKSLLTNLLAGAILLAGLLAPEAWIGADYLTSVGIFALSGGLTNWLAVKMLFDKVPGLYGSGVVAARFEEFKSGIQRLVMENFFSERNFLKFADAALHQGIPPQEIVRSIDLDKLFDDFVGVVAASKFAGMLSLAGGVQALESLRPPFKEHMRERLASVLEELDLTATRMDFGKFRPAVETLVQGKLDELKPEEVKRLVERMIRSHLGWLVIWGGVFGGLIGLAAAAAPWAAV